MSSQLIQLIIDRLNNLNNEIVNVVNEQPILTSRLNEIKNEQGEIYKLLQNYNENLYANFVSAKTINDHQNSLADKLNKYKENIESDIQNLEDETNHNIRLSKINKYFGDKYEAHSQLIKLLIFILIPVIILAVLKNKEFLPPDAFNALMLVIIVIGGIKFFKKYKDVVSRDNMNYQEYDWQFRQDLAPNNE